MLPSDVKTWLDQALVEGNFSGYESLAEALKERGFDISKSAVHRYGKTFEQAMAAAKNATEQAKAIAEACPDDAGMMNEALIRTVQTKIFEVLMELQVEPSTVKLTSLSKMISELSRASTTVKKYMAEVKTRALAAAEKVEAVVRKGGLTPDAVQTIRREILGISTPS